MDGRQVEVGLPAEELEMARDGGADAKPRLCLERGTVRAYRWRLQLIQGAALALRQTGGLGHVRARSPKNACHKGAGRARDLRVSTGPERIVDAVIEPDVPSPLAGGDRAPVGTLRSG